MNRTFVIKLGPYIFTFFDSHQFAVFSPEAMEIVTGEHEEPLFPPINSLDHNDGRFFRAMEWLMFFFRPPLPSMVFQWF